VERSDMEFFVEFEVTVPAGTAASEVDSREEDEATAAAQLARQGNLLRIWKLPARSGDAPTLGLYRADSRSELDALLRALPLYEWMRVVVTPLDRHPNDPASAPHVSARPASRTSAAEYLVSMSTHPPEGTSEQDVEEMRRREAARSHELASQGHLLRLWRPPLKPGEWRTIGLFAAENPCELEDVLLSMPLRAWRTDEVTPLSPHPNDPSASLRAAAPKTPSSPSS